MQADPAIEEQAPGCLEAVLAAALDRQHHAVLLVDCRVTLLFANRKAAQLLAAGRGIRLRDGVLQTLRPCETLALKQAVAACCACGAAPPPCGHFLPISQPEGRLPLACTVLPLPGQRAASVVIADMEEAWRPSPRQLQIQFGLTAAEAALAIEILAGDGLGACALRLGISRNTAGTHLRHVFEKTETNHQAQLVRLLMTIGTDTSC